MQNTEQDTYVTHMNICQQAQLSLISKLCMNSVIIKKNKKKKQHFLNVS